MIKKYFPVLLLTFSLLTGCNGNFGADKGNENNQVRDTNMEESWTPNQTSPYYSVTNDEIHTNRRTNGVRQMTNDKNNDEISATSTKTSSNNYPHTRPILIQEAKYDYLPTNEEQISNRNERIQRYFGGQFSQFFGGTNRGQGNNNQQAKPPNEGKTGAPGTNNQNQQNTTNPEANQNAGISEFARQVVNLTNEQRKKNGLAPLQIDTTLSDVAQRKSQDMQQNNYFSHTSPTYGSPFDMMRDFGVTYKTAGENIAQGQKTPKEVVNAWMNSSGHRANILNKNFTHIGVGFETQGYHWTQMFIGK
ncbi:CAP domain-containing protein [Caldibacillus thermoamylovorans]|uniref:CAP domain-containing protein n=1 Tax=Caldibacillus thermoamylovorans TaxID=35841 RepID=UPI00203D1E56|nr:CAP domain-containing protein [Caldibacillus thermoamylovorans]MCM3476476.1 CAP domain-containing protein [Caldibacillus thermoamylovorans]